MITVDAKNNERITVALEDVEKFVYLGAPVCKGERRRMHQV